MSVGINGINKLNANNFQEITIRQVDAYDYMVDVIGDNVKTTNNNFTNSLKGISNEERIVAIIERYLDNFKINRITSLVELKYHDGMWVVVYGNNGNSILRLQLFNSYFDEVFRKIKEKYLNDRYDFCWNEDINSFRLSIDSSWSGYGRHLVDCSECDIEAKCNYSKNSQCDEYGQLYLKLGNDGKVKDFEIEFIKEFLNYKFDLIGQEVVVKTNSIGSDNSLNRYISSHIIKCGEFELSFPHMDEFMFIFGIVNDYNNELFKINNDVKKRQLKMEGF